MERLIFHVDVNSAFLSWEAARRVKAGEPDLRLIPSAVGGDQSKRTGVILAKSIPAKKYGVTTGEPVSMALRKCPALVLARPDFSLYERCSAAFMDICREYAPVVEKYSIDECFLDMTGTSLIYKDPVGTAHEIKDRIRDTLGFTVNVGVGSNKLLAKTASDFTKPDRVHTLFESEIAKKLWPLPVGELFSVGGATRERLAGAGIRTVGELAAFPLLRLKALLGEKQGALLHDYSNGVDDSPVSDRKEDAKGYSVSTTLEADITSEEGASKVLLALADSVTARLRADNAKACCVGVTIRGADFKDRSHQLSLMLPTDITSEVYSVSRELFLELWDGVTPLRLLGIALTNIARGEPEQASLFDDGAREKARSMDRAVDTIRSRFGEGSISLGFASSRPVVGKKGHEGGSKK